MGKRGAYRVLCLLISVLLAFGIGCRPPEKGPGDEPPSAALPDPVTRIPRLPELTPSFSDTLAAIGGTDALGRSFEAYGSQKEGKLVGIFYFLWSGQHGSTGDEGGTLDVSKLSADVLKGGTSLGKHHYWGEPLYGYYDSGDPWVFGRHLELLSLAGIDYLVFDATNGYHYPEVLENILPVALEMREGGWEIPKFMFYCNTDSKGTVQKIYDDFYAGANAQRYADLWFRAKDGDDNAQNKPWIAARNDFGDGRDFGDLPQAVRDFFYLRPAQWPNEAGAREPGFDYSYKADGFPWMSWESAASGREQYDHSGLMSVSIAQHLSGAFSDAAFREGYRDRVYGRGWSLADRVNSAERIDEGSNFQEQWDYALGRSSVHNIFVTGWNEWVAQKQPAEAGRDTSYFVDLYDVEFSRDAEMMKGGYGDNYLMQIARNVRTFKAQGTLAGAQRSSAYLGVKAYLDVRGDTRDRNYKSSDSFLPPYTDDSGRNDIVKVTAAYDKDYLYFKLDCADDIQGGPEQDGGWMNLLFSADETSGGWEGYRYVVNRSFDRREDGSVGYRVDRLSADGSTTRAGEAYVFLSGSSMVICVPRVTVGCESDSFTLRFKAADHVTDPLDMMSYYATGDCAPAGRMHYTFRA